MKITYLFSLILCIIACNTKKEFITNNDSLSWLYTYNNESEKPTDSIIVYNQDFEKSLEFYKKNDSLEKKIEGIVYTSIFTVNKNKFSVILDSTSLKLFRFKNNKFKKTHTIDYKFEGNTYIHKIDFNSDGFKDIIINISSMGSYGSDYICLFYDPKQKTLVYDNNVN